MVAMRKVLPVLLMLSLAACGPALRWEKLGVTDQVAAADMTACRYAASAEANRYSFGYYPWGFGPPVWGMGRGNYLMWQIRQDNERFLATNRLAEFCMRNKGYEQVVVPQQPQTQPPPAPAPSPEPPLPK
jgi:hypothetical protein